LVERFSDDLQEALFKTNGLDAKPKAGIPNPPCLVVRMASLAAHGTVGSPEQKLQEKHDEKQKHGT
jgi:hypothetical protein